jgi:hypothetical protein
MARAGVTLKLLLAAACALALASCGTAATPTRPARAAAPSISLLLTQSATRGSLVPDACRCDGRQILTLRGVASQVVWFEDRPERHAGQVPARALARHWNALGFRSDPPNAALSLLDGAAEADTVIVELLGEPRYDRARGTMRYAVRLLPKASGKLADFAATRDARVPRRFGAASLFIDSASVRQVSAREMGAGRWRVEIS